MKLLVSTLIAFGLLLAAAFLTSARAQLNPDLKIISWNVFLRPHAFANIANKRRADAIVQRLIEEDADIVVLNEIFNNRLRSRMLNALEGQYFATDVLGGGNATGTNSGVIILSKRPFIRQTGMIFLEASGFDARANKGVRYAQISINERSYHIFATHTQSGTSSFTVRNNQFAAFRRFIDDQRIPAGDPVIIAGDLNVDFYGGQYRPMLAALAAASPDIDLLRGTPVTYDTARNTHLDDDHPSELLDYVLYSTNHASPSFAWNRIARWTFTDKGARTDLSDHYAILSIMNFGTQQSCRRAAQNWNNRHRRSNPAHILNNRAVTRLCRGAERTNNPVDCYDEVIKNESIRFDDRAPARRFHSTRLCRGTVNHRERIRCFEQRRAGAENWRLAMSRCSP